MYSHWYNKHFIFEKITNLDMSFWKRISGQYKNRTEDIYNLQSELDLSALEQEEIGLIDQLKSFELFKEGSNHKCDNLLMKKELIGNQFLFDHSFMIHHGKSASHYNQTVFFFDSKELTLPQFYLRPEHFGDKMLSWFGWKDINFSTHPEFSDRFKLTGEYEEIIRYYFDEKVLNFLNHQKNIYIEGMNYYLIIYTFNELIKPSDYPLFAKFCRMMYALFLHRSKTSKEDFTINEGN